jgi:hypothetical protein
LRTAAGLALGLGDSLGELLHGGEVGERAVRVD